MRDSPKIRLSVLAGLFVSTLLYAQQPSAPPSTLPATTPTTALAPTTPAAPLTPAQSPPQRAQVSWVNGDLTVSASNSSLNQILRDIARLSGLKITGGVTEERVFGSYGPGPLSEVLHSLLDGTGSNMLFIHSTGDNPSELILTTRTGGPTPPNPNAARYQDAEDEDPNPRPVNRPTPPPNESQSTPAPPNPTPQPITPPPADNSNNSPSPSTNQQQSPNGTKTPQQIYEELLRLRQQQQQQTQPQ